MLDEEKTVDDEPVIVRTGDPEHEFKVEIGFLELEVVAYTSNLKIVGYAHFGHGGRNTSRRASDHLRHIGEDRLTLSRARIYRQATDELLDTAPFVVINLDKVDVIYARDTSDAAEAGPTGAATQADPTDAAPAAG